MPGSARGRCRSTSAARGRAGGWRRLPFDRLLVAHGEPEPQARRPRRGICPACSTSGITETPCGSARRRPPAPASCASGWGSSAPRWPPRSGPSGCDVTVVEVFETTLYRILGPEIGRALEAIHRDHGVTMLFSDTVERFEGDGRLERVVTEGGVAIDADVAVVGVGTEPAVEIMAGNGPRSGRRDPGRPDLETRVPGGLRRRRRRAARPSRVRADPRRALRQRR